MFLLTMAIVIWYSFFGTELENMVMPPDELSLRGDAQSTPTTKI